MNIVSLDDILSKEEVARLAAKVSEALASDKTAVLIGGGEVLATVMGPQAIRDAIHQRVLKRLLDDPNELERLQHRLKNDDDLVS